VNALAQRRTTVIGTDIAIAALFALKCWIAFRKLTIFAASRGRFRGQSSRVFARRANAVAAKAAIDWTIVVTLAFFAQTIAAGRAAVCLAIRWHFNDFALMVAARLQRAVLGAIGRCFARRALAVAASDTAVFCAVVLASWVLFRAGVCDAFAITARSAAVFGAILGVFAAGAFAVAAGDWAVLRARAVFLASWRAFAVAAFGVSAGRRRIRGNVCGIWRGFAGIGRRRIRRRRIRCRRVGRGRDGIGCGFSSIRQDFADVGCNLRGHIRAYIRCSRDFGDSPGGIHIVNRGWLDGGGFGPAAKEKQQNQQADCANLRYSAATGAEKVTFS